MTVLSVNPMRVEMPSAASTGERSYVVTYQVITNDANDGPITVRDTAGIPFVNSTFTYGNDFDNGVYAVAYTVTPRAPIESRYVWDVAVTFSSTPSRRNDQYEDDPVSQSPIISGGGVRFSKIVEQDKDGSPIVNSVNDIITGIEKDDDRPTLRIQQNFNTIDLDQYATFASSVNSGTFFGLSARKWKMSHPRWEQRFRGNDTGYYTVTFEFEARSETWDLPLYDRGHFYLDAQANKKRFMAGNIIQSSPQNLDGIGGVQPANLSPADAPNSPYKLYAEKDFALLGIPIAL